MEFTDSPSPEQACDLQRISVCICTLKRPASLEKLLRALEGQVMNGLFVFSAVVVDNDSAQSARETVTRMAKELKYRVDYHVEPLQNIALARNRAVLNARGDLIATIDDDEVPDANWLQNLLKTLLASNADGVLGPVRPAFPPEAPRWLVQSGLCERDSYPTGLILTREHPLRTGNTLLHRRVFNGGKSLFEEQYGRTGGEDSEFFDKRIVEGFKFVWCDDAVVYEEVPPERCALSFQLKKFMRSGALTGEKMRLGTVPLWSNMARSFCASVFHTVMLPIYAVRGKHVLARHLARYLYHVSRLLGTFGVVILRER